MTAREDDDDKDDGDHDDEADHDDDGLGFGLRK
jgi:hypothetical protein